MTYEINVQEPYLSFIGNGLKTIEGRLNKGKFLKMKTGDNIYIPGIDKTFTISQKRIYSSFLEMLKSEDIKKVLPDKQTPTEGEKVYYKFFKKADEKRFGVAAIEIVCNQ